MPRIQYAGVAVVFIVVTMLLPKIPTQWSDRRLWIDWAKWILQHGLADTYGSGTDYPPVYQYVLAVFAWLSGTTADVDRFAPLLRTFTIVAELWGLWIVSRWTSRKSAYLLLVLISFCNPGYIYNTLFWGQIDAMYTAFSAASLYCLYKEKPMLSAALLTVALNTKIQTVIFIPLWGLLMIEYMARARKWRMVPRLMLCMLCVQGALLTPFALSTTGLSQLWTSFGKQIGGQYWISINAYNWWYWIKPATGDAGPIGVNDRLPLIGNLSAYHFGLLLFCAASLVAMLPILRKTLHSLAIRKNKDRVTLPPARETIWLSAALITVSFFFFNTEMHERYPHAAGLFLTAYAFYTRRWMLYLLFSVAYFLNLEGVQHTFVPRNYPLLIFEPRFISVLYGLLLAGLCYALYRVAPGNNAAARRGQQMCMRARQVIKIC